MNKFKKVAKYVALSGVALTIKKLWDPILDAFLSPVTAWIGKRAMAVALAVGIGAVA